MSEIILEKTFPDWAAANGINMDDPEDWEPWWDCWQTANKAGQDIGTDKGYNKALSDASAAIEELKQR